MLSGLATSQIQRPTIGLDFEISTPYKDPSKVDSLLIEFETLKITPRYLDEKEPVRVQAKVEVAGRVKKSNEVQASVVNGETKELESSINSIVINGLNVSESISGWVTISIDHPSMDKKTYRRLFTIADNTYYIQTFENTPIGNLPNKWSRTSSVGGDGDRFSVAENNGDKLLKHVDDRSGCTSGRSDHLIQPKSDAIVKINMIPSSAGNLIRFYGKDASDNARLYAKIRFDKNGNIKLSTPDESVQQDTYDSSKEYDVTIYPPDNNEVKFVWTNKETNNTFSRTLNYSPTYDFSGVTGKMRFTDCNSITRYYKVEILRK